MQLEASYSDPYDDPIYEIQIQKIEAKRKRDAEREAAAAAKAERELAIKAAAKAQELEGGASTMNLSAQPSKVF